VEGDDYDARKGIRRGDLVKTTPAQFHSGRPHEALELPLHFVHGRLRVLGVELKDKGDRASRERGAA